MTAMNPRTGLEKQNTIFHTDSSSNGSDAKNNKSLKRRMKS